MAYMRATPGGGGTNNPLLLRMGSTDSSGGYLYEWVKLDVTGINTITFKSWTSAVGASQGIAANVTDENGTTIGNIPGWTPAANAPISFDISNYSIIIINILTAGSGISPNVEFEFS